MKRLVRFAALILIAIPIQMAAFGQHARDSLDARDGGRVRDEVPVQRYISIRHDNDYLNLAGQGTDKYYTAGVYLQYSFTGAPRKNILNKVLFSPDRSDPSFLTVGLTQWMYTPDKIEDRTPVTGDYPFCGVLFLDLSRENVFASGTKLFRSELWLGTIGPAAIADQTQELVHRVIKAIRPDGWENQIPDYPVVNYNLYYESHLLSLGSLLKLNGLGAAQAGTLLNTVSAGFDLLISNERGNYFPDLIYDTRHGGSLSEIPSGEPGEIRRGDTRRTRLYLQFKPVLRFIGSDAVLQGGPFDTRNYYHIPAGDLERLVFSGTGIMGIRTRHFSIQYQQVYESPEFRTVHDHIYGSIGMSFAF